MSSCKSCDEGRRCQGADSESGLCPSCAAETGDSCAFPFRGESEDVVSFALRSGAPRVLASGLALTSAATNASQPVSLDECVAGSVLFEVLALTQDTSVELFVEGGFRQNFFRVSSTVFSEKGVWHITFSGLATPLMRLYYVILGNQNAGAIVGATLWGTGD